MSKKKAKLSYVEGAAGNSIYLNDFRIAGPKPWGGGKILKEWDVEIHHVLKALKLEAKP